MDPSLLPQDPTLSYVPSSRVPNPDSVVEQARVVATWSVRVPEDTLASDTMPGQVTSVPSSHGSAQHPDPAPVGIAGASPYLLQRLIGRGGMGEVWAATQRSLGRTVAVKCLHRDTGSDLDRIMRRAEFRQEAVIAASLEHPNIIPVHDFGFDPDGAPLMAMKLVQGQPWDRVLKADFNALSVEEFLARHLPVLVSMAQAVAFAHAHGIVHRDLKPSQVMLGEFGEVVLMDWGLALSVLEETDAPTSVNFRPDLMVELPTPVSASNPAGTPALMAPEQTRSLARDIGTWTDVYLLGGTLYFLLTATYPHDAANSTLAIARAAEGTIDRPTERQPGRYIPQELEDIALRALAKEPGARTDSARRFVTELQDYLSGSSKRKESTAITESVERRLGEENSDYKLLSDLLGALVNARTLWPKNDALGPLREEVLKKYATRALKEGDLLLARLQAEELSAGRSREELLNAVTSAEGAVQSRVRQRRIAIGATLALALIIAVGGTLFTLEVNKQRNIAKANETAAKASEEVARERAAEAEVQRHLAQTSQLLADQRATEAEKSKELAMDRLESSRDLLFYMLENLRGSLDLSRESDLEIAEALGRGVTGYLRSSDASSYPEDLRLAHAEQLQQLGGRLSQLGLWNDARWLMEESLRIYALCPSADPRKLRKARHLKGTIHLQFGELDQAAEMFTSLMEETWSPEEFEDADTMYISSINNLAAAYLNSGREEAAFQLMNIAVDKLHDHSERSRDAIAAVLTNYSASLHGVGRIEEALRVVEKVVLDPDLLPPVTEPGRYASLASYATLLSMSERPEEALAVVNSAIEDMEKNFGPDHPVYARVLLNRMKVLQRLGRPEEAVEDGLRSMDILRESIGIHTPESLFTLHVVADVLLAANQLDKALELLAEGEKHARNLTQETRSVLLTIMEKRFVCLYLMGRREEALDKLAELMEESATETPATPERRQTFLLAYVEKLLEAERLEEAELHSREMLDITERLSPELRVYDLNRVLFYRAVTLFRQQQKVDDPEEKSVLRQRFIAEFLSRRVDINFDNPIHLYLIEFLALEGREDEARQIAEEQISRGMDTPPFRRMCESLGIPFPDASVAP